MKQFYKELAELMRKHGVSTIGFEYEGDYYGIYNGSFVVYDQNGGMHIIVRHQTYCTPRDLEDVS